MGRSTQESKLDNSVFINVYDLTDQNRWTYWCGVGVFHAGLEVYGVEYAYGGGFRTGCCMQPCKACRHATLPCMHARRRHVCMAGCGAGSQQLFAAARGAAASGPSSSTHLPDEQRTRCLLLHVPAMHACAGHDYDCSGIFATSPHDPPGQGRYHLLLPGPWVCYRSCLCVH